MLSAAEAELVSRDPALRALGLLLDGECLSAWLSDAGVDGQLTRRYLRYKPATSCVLAGELRTEHDTQTVILTAYADEAGDKLGKTASRAPEGAVLARDDALLLLATTAAADRDLPAARLLAQDRSLRRLMQDLLPDVADWHGVQLRTLSHKPQRRWVVRVTPREGPELVVRAYRAADVESALSAVQVLSDGRPRTPLVLGADVQRAVVVTEWLPGQPLDRLVATGPADAELAQAGAALARLHQHRETSLRRHLAADEREALHAAAGHVALLLPGRAADARTLADRVVARLAHDDEPATAVHGDFSIDQVIALDEGGVALIDLDSAVHGSPAADLASAAAGLVAGDVLPSPSAAPSPTWEALLAGYAVEARLPATAVLRARTAGMLLRRAVDPFRLCAPGWPGLSSALLQHGLTLLDADGG